MSTTYTPYVLAIPSAIPSRDGLQETPPIWWHSLASDINAESGSGWSNGRYNPALGQIESHGRPSLQDTYLNGTGSRSGRAFTAVAGTWKDDAVSPWSDKYCLMQPDSTLASWEVKDYATQSGLRNTCVVIHTGIAPAANAGAHDGSACYFYLELANGSTTNFRLAFKWGEPIRMEITNDGGTTWNGRAYSRDLPSFENYLAHNKEIRLTIRPEPRRGIIAVEVGDGHWIRYSTPRPAGDLSEPNAIGVFPSVEKYRFYGAYRWVKFEVHPLSFSALTVNKGPRNFSSGQLVNAQNASVLTNLVGDSNSKQADSLTLQPDGVGGLGYNLSSSNTDTTIPSTASDIVIFIPSRWTTSFWGLPLPEAILSSVKYRELQTWDDATRMGMTSGLLTVNNRNHLYAGVYGNHGIDIVTGNGLTFGQRLRGIASEVQIHRSDPINIADFQIRDFWQKLEVPLGQDVILDGLCIYTAVRLLLDIGQVNPSTYATTIPDTGFPGPGGYSDDFPFYILGKGTGLSPKYRFGPEMSVVQVLQELIQDSGQPDLSRGVTIPHYMFFDSDGQFHYEPYDPSISPVVQVYGSNDPSGYGQLESLTVYNSVSQMRSEVILQGQDAFTYELLQLNLPLPANLGAVGFQFRWLERNERYATPAYLELIGRAAVRQASLPTQIVKFTAPYWSHVFAGQVIAVPEVGAGLFQVLEVDSTLGHDPVYHGGTSTHCRSTITARSLINAIP